MNWVDPWGLELKDYFNDGIIPLKDNKKRRPYIDGSTLDTLEKRQEYYEPQIRQKAEELSNIRIHTQIPDKGEMAARIIAGFYSLLEIGVDDNLEECK